MPLVRGCRARGGDASILHGWRALFALCRLAGLRPGEALELPWSGTAIDTDGQTHRVGVDWERCRVCLVGKHKTKRVYREVPMMPRLRKILVRAYDAAPKGQVMVASVDSQNLTRDAERHVHAAGLVVWKKPYQAMRSSCENDWKQRGVAEPTYCTWLGHSSAVSRRHYVSPTEAEFEAITGPGSPR